MNLTRLSISNYRGLKDVTIPLSRFVCLIGENNSGKSSFLQALALFFSGSKLAQSNYFDEAQPIRIAVTFEGIVESDLARLAEEHRERVAGIIRDGRLTLVRIFAEDGKSSLLFNTLVPNDPRFSSASISELVKGQRAGAPFAERVSDLFPELRDTVNATMSQEVVKQRIQELADLIPDDQKSGADVALPTGIDKSIEPMLPSPIYIPAVKDLADDTKTTESTPFGKILAILLPEVEAKLPNAKEWFDQLNSKLNRIGQPDGTFVDERLDEIRSIESTLERYVREGFANVAVRIAIPPPELKTVLAATRIYADDGVEGLVESKGDGLRRAVVFAILRSYVEMRSRAAPTPATVEPAVEAVVRPRQVEPAPASFLLLFEEPELFLHPKAQHVLFDALRVFANEHHILVSTHSPMFFGPGATGTFVKLRKTLDRGVALKPFTRALAIDLSDMSARDQFQLICFENNNAAFFAETTVLVEGDSDYLVMPHIARTLDAAWDVAHLPVVFVRVTGKGNIRRYREFFSRFGARVPVVADLDVLIGGFEHLAASADVSLLRTRLMAAVDTLVMAEEEAGTAKEAKAAHASGDLRGLWRRVKECRSQLLNGTCSPEEHDEAVEAFFSWQRRSARLEVLRSSVDEAIVAMKCQLLEKLRGNDVFLLERGAIEEYYPEWLAQGDKPSRALEFCQRVATRDAVLNCCKEQEVERDGVRVREKEFSLVFKGIFSKANEL